MHVLFLLDVSFIKNAMNEQRRVLWPWQWRWLVVSSWVLVAVGGVEMAEVAQSELEAFRDERGGLVALRDGLRSARDLHSNWTGPPCHGARSRWYGVSCDGDGRVVALALDGAQLTGALPPGALRNVTRLAALTLRGNAIRGALPGLDGLERLRVVDLSSNRFSGAIPRGYAASLRELARIELQDNLLSGTVPAFAQRGLLVFNVSYNFLHGEVPDTRALRRFPASAFDHNLRLCGEAVNAACDRSGSPSADDDSPATGSRGGPAFSPEPDDAGGWQPRRSWRFRLATWSVVVIALIVAMVPFAAVLIFLHQTKKSREVRLGGRAAPAGAAEIKDKAEQGKVSESSSGSVGRSAQLQFFHADKGAGGFDLDDLFRSTAEMLGKGRLGITYRVTLEAGAPAAVVVKRLRNMGHVPRRDFAHTMQLLGKLRYENVVEVVACYHSKEEKLVVYEHVPGCSLFQLLHENRGEGRTPLPWPARLAIAKGMARGLAYLLRSLPFFHRPPHGNLKSSNVLIFSPPKGKHRHHQQQQHGSYDGEVVPKLTDYGFHPLLPHHAHRLAAAKCPEHSRGKLPSSRTDVFCLGLVLLEVVTGKVPVDEADGDLAEWARLALSHEWSTEILDVEIVGDRDRHEDMLRLTEIALLCAAVEPDRRPKMADVVRMIDEIGAAAAAAADGGEGRWELAMR